MVCRYWRRFSRSLWWSRLNWSIYKDWSRINLSRNTKAISSAVYTPACLNTETAHTHTHPFNDPFSGTTRVSRYQKGKTNLDFAEARDSEWQWHQLGHMQVCNSLQTDNHARTPPLSFLQAGCPSCRPTNSVKALKAQALKAQYSNNQTIISAIKQ